MPCLNGAGMASSLLAACGGVALFLAAGWGVTAWVPELRQLPAPRRAGYSYLLGVATLGSLLYAGSHFAGLPLRRPVFLIFAGALATLGILRSRTTATPRSSSPLDRGERLRLPNLLRRGSALLSTLVVVGAFADSVSRPLEDWDGRMTWSVRAKHLRAEGTVDAEVLRDRSWSVSHPRYPLLLPIAQVVVEETFATPEDDPAFRALYPAFLAALLLVFYDAALRWTGPIAAPLTVALLASTPLLSFWHEGGAIGAYSDLPLAAFYGSGSILLLRSRHATKGFATALAGGALLAGAVLSKNEGAALALLALTLTLLPRLAAARAGRGRKALGHWGAAAAIALLGLGLLYHWKDGIPNRNDEKYGLILTRQGGVAAGRIPANLAAALPEVLRQTIAWPQWHLLPWTAPLFVLLGRRALSRRRGRSATLLALLAAGPLLLAWSAYGLHWDSAGLARVTWNRLVLQGAIPLALLLALAIRGALAPGRNEPQTLSRADELPPSGTELAASSK